MACLSLFGYPSCVCCLFLSLYYVTIYTSYQQTRYVHHIPVVTLAKSYLCCSSHHGSTLAAPKSHIWKMCLRISIHLAKEFFEILICFCPKGLEIFGYMNEILKIKELIHITYLVVSYLTLIETLFTCCLQSRCLSSF